MASAVGHVVGEYVGSSLYADYQNGDITLDELQNTTIALASAVGGATVLLTQENVSQEELNRATAMASSVVENNFLPLVLAAAAIGVSEDMIVALGFAVVYAIIENNKDASNTDILSEISYAVASTQSDTSNNQASVNGIGVLNNQDSPIVGGVQDSVEDIKTSTGIPQYNDDSTPTIGGGITGELVRPEVGGFEAQTQDRPTVGGMQTEEHTGTVYTAGGNDDLTNQWGNPSALEDHVNRHGLDFDTTDAVEYVQLSQNFLHNSLDNGYDIYKSEQGYVFVYDQSTNTFGLYNPDGTTTTFYKPTDGVNYMDEQIEKYNLERVNN